MSRVRAEEHIWYGKNKAKSLVIKVQKHNPQITKEQGRYMTIIDEFDKETALKVLDEIIHDLIDLEFELRGGEKKDD